VPQEIGSGSTNSGSENAQPFQRFGLGIVFVPRILARVAPPAGLYRSPLRTASAVARNISAGI
jgi:hypothetical protein